MGEIENPMPRKILVIEDEQDLAHLVELHLRDLGYEVSLAHDGRVGLEQALSQSYDLIILNLMLPGLEGLELCRRLRTKPNYTPHLDVNSQVFGIGSSSGPGGGSR